VVVGGGYVALEVAASLAAWGFPVDVIIPGPHIMTKLWTAEIAGLYEKEFGCVVQGTFGVVQGTSSELSAWFREYSANIK
jgi:NADPH-dependent 2,4-dienoyl-CoA reductase/sulfur reductase-like enzyme